MQPRQLNTPQEPPAGGERGKTKHKEGPVDRMGNVLCSLDSLNDFPPLNQQINIRNRFTILGQWEERDSNEGLLEESISSSEGDISLSDNMEISFQEALSREKAPEKKDK